VKLKPAQAAFRFDWALVGMAGSTDRSERGPRCPVPLVSPPSPSARTEVQAHKEAPWGRQ